jgi:hypothetical protein
MSSKKSSGSKPWVIYLLTILGVGILGYGCYFKWHIEPLRKEINSTYSYSGKDPIKGWVAGGSHAAKHFESKVHLMMAMGAVVTALGVVYLIRSKK